MPRLIVLSGVDAGAEFELGAGVHRIGRRATHQVLLRDRSVSRDHCELVVKNSDVMVTDLESANGTSVDGIRLAGPVRLSHDGIIRLGAVAVRVELGRVSLDESSEDVSAIFDMRAFGRRPAVGGRPGAGYSQEPLTVRMELGGQVEAEPVTDRLDLRGIPDAGQMRPRVVPSKSDGVGCGPSPTAAVAAAAAAAAAALLAMLTLWLVFGTR